jgi:hypothetical protein
LKGVVNYHVPNSITQNRYETNTSTNLIQNRSSTPQNPTQVVSPLHTRNNNLNKTRNNNLNKARNRKRVSSMAPEIKQEIKEAINQRRLTTLSRARATQKNIRNKNFEVYDKLFIERLTNPTYKQSLVNKLEKLYPGIDGK